MFSASGTYPAVGLFSTTHIISIVICFVLIGVLVFFSRNMDKSDYFKILKWFAIIFTLLETFKILWSLSHGYTNVNSWVPLYFCSLFIYALWFSWLGNKFIREVGLSFIAMASIIAGSVFIVCPSTSFSTYPIFHFQCIYSMLYHSAMVYSGIMLFKTKALEINFKAVFKYILFCVIFMTFALVINISFGGNMMFISNPKGIPLPFLVDVYNASPLTYTTIVISAHMMMGVLVLGVDSLLSMIFDREKKKEEPVTVIEVNEENIEI